MFAACSASILPRRSHGSGGVAGGWPPALRNCSLGTLGIAGGGNPLGQVEAADDAYQEPGCLTEEVTEVGTVSEVVAEYHYDASERYVYAGMRLLPSGSPRG